MECCACKKELSAKAFAWKIKGSKRQAHCRKCQAVYRREHYQRNRAKYIGKARRWNAKQKEALVRFLREYLVEHPCVDCGETRLPTLDFDHVRGKKWMTIAQMLHNRYSVAAVKAEIAKCDVRCANCHRVRTTKKGWWRAGR